MPLIARPAAGQIVDPAWGTLVADAVVQRFTTAAQRTSLLTAPVVGQLTTLDTALGVIEYWTGTAWVSTRELFYAQFTAPVVPGASLGAAVTVVTGPAVTYDSTPIIVEFFANAVSPPAVASGQTMFNLFDGATDLGYFGTVVGNGIAVPVLLRRRITPTAGPHTYLVKAWTPTGTGGSIGAGVGGGPGLYSPGYLTARKP